MRVLVIGGGGLLGTHLVPRLVKEGHEVAICDNLSGCPRINPSDGVRLFTPNVTDLNSTRQAFNVFKPEAVIFAAAHHNTRDILYNFFDDVRLALDSANVLTSLLTRSVKHVYFCSSSEVYGGPQSNKPLKENRKISTSTTHHGTAKLAAEQLLSFRCQELGINFTSLRIFDMYGPRVMFCPRTGIISFVINTFLFHQNDTVGLVGAAKQKDFIHVEDVAKTIVSLLGTDFCGTVNIGTGVGVTSIQIVKALAGIIKIVNPPVIVPDGPVPTFSAVADTTLLKTVLPGWKPSVDVIKYLPELVAFHQRTVAATTNNPLGVLNASRGL